MMKFGRPSAAMSNAVPSASRNAHCFAHHRNADLHRGARTASSAAVAKRDEVLAWERGLAAIPILYTFCTIL